MLEKFTVNGTVPDNGAPLAAAMGGRFVATEILVTVMVIVLEDAWLVPLETVRKAK